VLNRAILVGRLATDPELKYTPGGVAVCNFRLAIDRSFTTAQGERETDFLTIVAWRQTAEFSANYLHKGRLVFVEGRIQARSWTAPDGTKRYATEVVADNVRALDRPREAGERGADAGADTAGPEPAPADDAGDPFADQ
jgi:single-strand DNA-binding protein